MLSDVYANAIRLGANLIATRLLFPEAFGLMVIVNLVFTALNMLSDVGIRGAIISKQGTMNSAFIDTAWSMSILRGVVLSIAALSIAYPVATYYEQEQLFGLIMLASVAPVITGFSSPYPILEEKSIRFRRVVLWKTVTQTLSTLILIAWLLVHPTIWALAANGIVSAVIGVLGSYYFFSYRLPRLAWDRAAAWEIFLRGRWIFIASGLSFLARQGDSLIVSNWVAAEVLGTFSIALAFAKLVEMLIERLSYSLLFPVYAELRSRTIEEFNAKLRKVKLALFSICAPPILIFALFGRDIVSLLYDARYHQAGWMLEVMAAGSIFYAAGASILNIPLSFGNTYHHMWLQFVRFAVLLIVMICGASLAGTEGLVMGIGVAQGLFFPLLCLVAYRYDIKGFLPESLFIVTLSVMVLTNWHIRGWPI